MTLQEFFLRLFYALKDLIPVLITGIAATIIALVVLYFLSRGAWIRDKRFLIVGILFGLPPKGRFRLACMWLKLVFLCYFLVMFRSMSAMHYWIFLVPGLLTAFLDTGVRRWIQGLFWLGIQLLGLFSANMICRFIRDMAGNPVFILIYIAIALFLALLSLYLFLSELLSLSDHRRIDPRSVWEEAEEES